MEQTNLNDVTFVGIDAHPSKHTALAINRFEDEKGILRFENTREGIALFLSWLPTIDIKSDNVVVGIEGGAGMQNELLRQLLINYSNVYEINSVYTSSLKIFASYLYNPFLFLFIPNNFFRNRGYQYLAAFPFAANSEPSHPSDPKLLALLNTFRTYEWTYPYQPLDYSFK